MLINFQKPFFNLCHSDIDDNGGFNLIPNIKVDLVNSYGTIHGFKDNLIDGQENGTIRSKKLSNLFLRRTENSKIHGSYGTINLENANKTEIQSFQKNRLKYFTLNSPSKTRLSPTPDINSTSLHRQNYLELIADPNYYHTVHGGQKKHVTASRSAEPFAPITRISIDDRSVTQPYQPDLAKASNSVSSSSNRFGAQRISLKLVRPCLTVVLNVVLSGEIKQSLYRHESSYIRYTRFPNLIFLLET